MFFCNVLIIVEGIEDVAYLMTYLALLDYMDEFHQLGCHIVPMGGKSKIIKPLATARLLSIPTYVVFDADTHETNPQKQEMHKRDNRQILNIQKSQSPEWPKSTIWKPNLTMWHTCLTQVINDELGDGWIAHQNRAESHYGNPGGLKKNPLAISLALENAWNEGLRCNSLTLTIEGIMKFSRGKTL